VQPIPKVHFGFRIEVHVLDNVAIRADKKCHSADVNANLAISNRQFTGPCRMNKQHVACNQSLANDDLLDIDLGPGKKINFPA